LRFYVTISKATDITLPFVPSPQGRGIEGIPSPLEGEGEGEGYFRVNDSQFMSLSIVCAGKIRQLINGFIIALSENPS